MLFVLLVVEGSMAERMTGWLGKRTIAAFNSGAPYKYKYINKYSHYGLGCVRPCCAECAL
jgi:hypothetical protein